MKHCDELPYERGFSKGLENLTDRELLAILLQTGCKGESVSALADEVYEQLNVYSEGLTGLCRISLRELMEIDGIGRVKALRLKAVAEISGRISRTKAHSALMYDNPATIAAYYMETMRHERVEQVRILLLDACLGFVGEELLSCGTVDEVVISPIDVFGTALKRKAVRMVLIHNHPSGQSLPSQADITFTKNIYSVGKMLQIELEDHIIIGDNSYYSFRENGIEPYNEL